MSSDLLTIIDRLDSRSLRARLQEVEQQRSALPKHFFLIRTLSTSKKLRRRLASVAQPPFRLFLGCTTFLGETR